VTVRGLPATGASHPCGARVSRYTAAFVALFASVALYTTIIEIRILTFVRILDPPFNNVSSRGMVLLVPTVAPFLASLPCRYHHTVTNLPIMQSLLYSRVLISPLPSLWRHNNDARDAFSAL